MSLRGEVVNNGAYLITGIKNNFIRYFIQAYTGAWRFCNNLVIAQRDKRIV